MLTLVGVLLVAALIMTLANAARPSLVPLWVPLLLVILALLLRYVPVG